MERATKPVFPELITAKDVKNLATSVLGPEVDVVEYTVRDYSDEKIGFLSSHRRLVIVTKCINNDPGIALQSTSFFVKAMPYDVPTQAKYVREKGVFQQEANFFRNVVPELSVGFDNEPWAPECHIIKNDCLVFEDLRSSGYFMSEKLLNEEQIKSGLGAIARLHAASLRAEKRLGRRLGDVYPAAFKELAFAEHSFLWYSAGVDVAVTIAENLSINSSRIPEACATVFEAIKSSRFKQNVASHGDLWSNNLMFDNSQPPRCRLVDFQLARYSPLAHDVAQFLYLCASKRFRDERSDEMLEFYYASLGEQLKKNSDKNFVEIPAWNDVKLGYEEQKLGAIVTAVMYFPTVLLDGQLGAQIMNDPVRYEQFVKHDRRDIVVENMRRDKLYRERLEETVRELVEYSMILEQLPVPC